MIKVVPYMRLRNVLKVVPYMRLLKVHSILQIWIRELADLVPIILQVKKL